MTRKANPLDDLNSQAKRAADQTKEKILAAVDNYFNFLQKTISSYPTGGMELGQKTQELRHDALRISHRRICRRNSGTNDVLWVAAWNMQKKQTFMEDWLPLARGQAEQKAVRAPT